MLNPFMDLATALGQKIGSMFVSQGVSTPTQRAVSSNGDSMDFWAATKKLLQPVDTSSTPKSGVSILEGASSIGNEIFNSLGRNVGSYIDNLFGNGNKATSKEATQVTNVTAATEPFSSQVQNLGELFKVFSQIQSGNPSASAQTTTPQQNNNTVLIIGGVVALAVVLIATRRTE